MNDERQSSPERRADGRTGETHTAGAGPGPARRASSQPARPLVSERFEPPFSALAPLFIHRLERIHACRVSFELEVNPRPTQRVLGGYYRSRRLVRVYSHDTADGRRPMEELFDTFLHEVAHHLEYTEPFTFGSRACRRVPGLMHSRLFWRILGDLKWRWTELKRQRRV